MSSGEQRGKRELHPESLAKAKELHLIGRMFWKGSSEIKVRRGLDKDANCEEQRRQEMSF